MAAAERERARGRGRGETSGCQLLARRCNAYLFTETEANLATVWVVCSCVLGNWSVLLGCGVAAPVLCAVGVASGEEVAPQAAGWREEGPSYCGQRVTREGSGN